MKRNTLIIAQNLINKLWDRFRFRVPYAGRYAHIVSQKGGRVVHDHLAFRTLNTHTGELPEGISAVRHIIRCLGYQPAGRLSFPGKKLNALYFEHPGEITLPKIFVSQLEVEQLPPWAQQMIRDTVKETPYLLSDNSIELLGRLKTDGILTSEGAEFLENELVLFFGRPWQAPLKETILKINDVSHYAAWVLLHGNAVSHFAAFFNCQGVKQWPDLETTCEALAKAGIPMKPTIEGPRGSPLRQAGTLAVKEDVEVTGEDGPGEIPWTYAYFEIAERGFIEENGQRKMYSGFLEKQARHFFNLTRTLEN